MHDAFPISYMASIDHAEHEQKTDRNATCLVLCLAVAVAVPLGCRSSVDCTPKASVNSYQADGLAGIRRVGLLPFRNLSDSNDAAEQFAEQFASEIRK